MQLPAAAQAERKLRHTGLSRLKQIIKILRCAQNDK